MLQFPNKKASPPGRHQEQASKQASKQRWYGRCCTFSPTTFSSVVWYTIPYHTIPYGMVHKHEWFKKSPPASTLLAVVITPTTTAGFSKGFPALPTEFTGRLV